MKVVHKLKIYYEHADAKLSGDKLFEIRDNKDKGFQKGDIVEYTVVDKIRRKIPNHPLNGKQYEITYVTNFAQKENYVVFGEREIDGEK